MTFTKAKILCFSLILPFSSLTFAEQSQTNCQLISQSSVDVFTAVDYQATFAQYPTSLQKKAQRVLLEIENKEQSFIDLNRLTEEQELELATLEARLENIMRQACIEPITIDLLASLSDSEQLKALTLWREIQQITAQLDALEQWPEQQSNMTNEQEQLLNTKLDQLENVLMASSY